VLSIGAIRSRLGSQCDLGGHRRRRSAATPLRLETRVYRSTDPARPGSTSDSTRPNASNASRSIPRDPDIAYVAALDEPGDQTKSEACSRLLTVARPGLSLYIDKTPAARTSILIRRTRASSTQDVQHFVASLRFDSAASRRRSTIHHQRDDVEEGATLCPPQFVADRAAANDDRRYDQ